MESFFSNFDSQNIPNEEVKENSLDKDKPENNTENKFNHSQNDFNSEKSNNFNNTNISCLNDYEELLRKHESEIRNHIKIQHQYRIYSDNLKNKIEELEKSKADCKKTIANLQEVIFIPIPF